MRTKIDQLYPDIWQQVFEYFNAIELFNSLVHVTTAADEALFGRNHHFRFRKLAVDVSLQALPENLPLSQVVSLELHEENCIDIIEQCSEVRSLKLIGQPKWVIYLLKKASYIDMKLEQLTLVVPGIGFLHNLLGSISPLLSLRRLEIHADQLEERINCGSSFLTETKIEQFILHSCSSISWNDLSYMLPALSNIRFLDITLFRVSKNPLCSFSFPKLRSISLVLLEIPFDSIIQLVKTTPFLVKLKLNGLVDAEGFVINNKWLNLFESSSSLVTVTVSLSLEQDTNSYYNELILEDLREINIGLSCIDDDCEHYSNGRNKHRWWNLSGIIVKQDRRIKGKHPTSF
jgi:hypothetical protein